MLHGDVSQCSAKPVQQQHNWDKSTVWSSECCGYFPRLVWFGIFCLKYCLSVCKKCWIFHTVKKRNCKLVRCICVLVVCTSTLPWEPYDKWRHSLSSIGKCADKTKLNHTPMRCHWKQRAHPALPVYNNGSSPALLLYEMQHCSSCMPSFTVWKHDSAHLAFFQHGWHSLQNRGTKWPVSVFNYCWQTLPTTD